MEPNNQEFSSQNSTSVSAQKPNHFKIVKWVFIVFVVICLLLGAIMSWLSVKQNVPPKIITVKIPPQLTLPEINKSPLTTLKNIPTDIQLFITDNATEQTYNTIQYSNKQTGFQSSYVIVNSTVNQMMMNFLKQINFNTNSNWVFMGGSSFGVNGSVNFSSKTLPENVSVTFTQQDKDVKVVVQSLNTK
jgi:hypothetical protein